MIKRNQKFLTIIFLASALLLCIVGMLFSATSYTVIAVVLAVCAGVSALLGLIFSFIKFKETNNDNN